ncbi:hypothetical protein RYX56_06400 [Alkalihalophilus lindianensis]|uniref:NERD domain-containing protein n=1 Tax=Alkalihalophilus lindianensis TaxID=1630542 RepID=A0ABU3X8P3_9BACI|nr:hypothetical protein [Alkalihalophilus lindianensis]MDV2684002.1 hypothetical protein [Alkalihalophilus lindianensis]
MQCYFCGKRIHSSQYGLVCKQCEVGSFLARASESGLEQWLQSLLNPVDNFTWTNVKKRISILIKDIKEKHPLMSLLEQAKELDHLIIKEIKTVLSYYHKEDLITATLSIKEACRIKMLDLKEDEDLWSYQNEYSVAILLQREIMMFNDEMFLGASIEEKDQGYYGFITAIVYARVLVLLRDNCEKYKILKHTEDLMEMSFKFHEDQTMADFFNRYMKDGTGEKPEDLRFEDKDLFNDLNKRGLTYAQIKESIAKEVNRQFGVSFDELNKIFNIKDLFLEKTDDKLPLKIIRKEKLLKEGFNIDNVMQVINLFSINKIPSRISYPVDSHYELRSIYEVGDFIVFGKIDLIQNISIFEKLIISGHFLTMYDERVKLSSVIRKAQNKLSSLFAFKLTEVLKQSKYIVPTEIKSGKKIVRAEIDTILNYNNKKSILKQKDGKNLGDIDVLAINPISNEVILYELKFFKPASSFREMVYSDKRRLVKDEVVKKMMNRQNAVEEHIDSVVAFIGGDTDKKYSVRSILVTIRSNYFCYFEDIGIDSVTWNELLEEIRTNH